MKMLIKQLNTCLQMETRRFFVVAYKHVTKCVENVKNDIYTRDNPSSGIE